MISQWEPTLTDEDSGTTYAPFIGSYGQVGYRVERTDGEVAYLYLNPSNGSGGDPDHRDNVFVYLDTEPEAFDGALHYYDIWEDP